MMPHLAFIVDRRYSADYASVYAISQIAVCFAYGIAPLIGSQLARIIGFYWLMILIGTLNVSYSLFANLFLLPTHFQYQSAKQVRYRKEPNISRVTGYTIFDNNRNEQQHATTTAV